jgi:hypothetical protein
MVEINGEAQLSALVDAWRPRIEQVCGNANAVGDSDAKSDVELPHDRDANESGVCDAPSDAATRGDDVGDGVLCEEVVDPLGGGVYDKCSNGNVVGTHDIVLLF